MTSRTLSRVALSGILSVGLFAGAACSDSSDGAPTVEDPVATGRELATEFLTLLVDADTEGLDDFLADGFQIQRADGTGGDKEEYLADLPTVDSFELGDTMIVTQDDDALTLRWTLVADEAVTDNQTEQQLSTDEAPRLSTFVWRDGRWRLMSHANFNLPAS